MVEEDDIASELTELLRLKTQNKALAATKESTEKVKEGTEVKVKQLLQDKADLKSCTQRLRLNKEGGEHNSRPLGSCRYGDQ